MRYHEIKESPIYDPNEMSKPPQVGELFLSVNTLKDEYTEITQIDMNGQSFMSVIHDDGDYAVMGAIGTRSGDNAQGIFIDCQISFKPGVDASYSSSFGAATTKQVDLVQIYARPALAMSTRRGVGYQLYKSIVMSGTTLVSDYLQYRGGKELWLKVARMSKHDGFSVFVFKDSGMISDTSGIPIKYDGTNIPDSDIWSSDGVHKQVLLVAKKN